MKRSWLVLALALGLTGCLQKDVEQTLYIEPDGTVTWEFLESGVRSDADTPADRAREHRDYLQAARSGRPEALLALEELGGYDAESTLLRDRPPFVLHATARFDDPAQAINALLTVLHASGSASLESEGNQTTLTIHGPFESETTEEDDGPAARMLMQAETIQFVLAQGTFVEAVGFEIHGGRRAVLIDDNSESESLRLVWRTDVERGR